MEWDRSRIPIDFLAVIHIPNSFDSFLNLEPLANPVIVLSMLVFWWNSFSIMHVFSDTMKKADTTLKLLKIDPLNKNIHKPLDALDVGMGVNLHLYTWRKSEKYKGSLVLNFHKGVILLLSNITAHVIEKCPLKHQIVRCASSLNPNNLELSARNESSKLKFSKMVGKANCTQADLYQTCSIKFPQDIKILGWCPAGPVLPHWEEVPL